LSYVNDNYETLIDILEKESSVLKVWKIVNLFNFERKQPMHFKTFNCWEALRHIFLIW
jgi:hypothetical protein